MALAQMIKEGESCVKEYLDWKWLQFPVASSQFPAISPCLSFAVTGNWQPLTENNLSFAPLRPFCYPILMEPTTFSYVNLSSMTAVILYWPKRWKPAVSLPILESPLRKPYARA
jgi:hypothetical protein